MIDELGFLNKQPTIILIDHNDSFTYNIVESFKVLKQELTVILYKDLSTNFVANFDKIILSPGPMLPNKYPKTLAIIKKFYKTKSILGICLGHQALCEFFNAKLINLNSVKHGVEQALFVLKNNGIFKNIPNRINVGLYHSWAVSKDGFPAELNVTSNSTDKIIMSFKHKQYPIYGIQFHPESFLTTEGNKILQNFITL